MQVSVEKTSDLSRKMTVIIPEALVQEHMATRLKSLAREVKVDGFRPGKVPPQIIKKMYGEKVRHEISADLVQLTYPKALESENLNPVNHPFIDYLDQPEGLAYTAIFEVYPDISLENLNQLEVVRPAASVEESNVDAMIEKLRQQKMTWTTVERPTQNGDRVTINFSGTSEEESFTNGLIENYSVEIGSKQMIPGFEDNLIGLTLNENKKFTLTFPEQYGNAALAGKSAEFDVTVLQIEESSLPEIDAEFIKSYGIEDGDAESFRNDVKSNMVRELAKALQGKLKNAVLDSLLDKVIIAVPNALVDKEIEELVKPYLEMAKRQKIKLDDLQITRDHFIEQAKRRVALGLILGEVIKQNEIKLDHDKVRETIENMAKSYEQPEEVVNWYYADPTRLQDVHQMVLENQTVDWLLSVATVTEESVNFTDIMDKQ